MRRVLSRRFTHLPLVAETTERVLLLPITAPNPHVPQRAYRMHVAVTSVTVVQHSGVNCARHATYSQVGLAQSIRLGGC